MRLTKLVAGGRNKGRFQSFVTRDYHAELGSLFRSRSFLPRRHQSTESTYETWFAFLAYAYTRCSMFRVWTCFEARDSAEWTQRRSVTKYVVYVLGSIKHINELVESMRSCLREHRLNLDLGWPPIQYVTCWLTTQICQRVWLTDTFLAWQWAAQVYVFMSSCVEYKERRANSNWFRRSFVHNEI